MANNEEKKILVLEADESNLNQFIFDLSWEHLDKIKGNEISCSEAIYKMAKALCNWYYTACSECALKDKPKECFRLLKDASFYEQAESALNALLKDNK